ncbi:hypothetical protein CYMTET_29615 [Cymbomonas tetramitiformis]|uniref:Uncharacterized protein n=1 Tax=Cymbomonas tetramitiformis TaxID=36881 RepID=A0AAE0FKP6_9CHLO|nr:hypothetical protein CYMTET_29615 [Cymbomonas tetramitiformis]
MSRNEWSWDTAEFQEFRANGNAAYLQALVNGPMLGLNWYTVSHHSACGDTDASEDAEIEAGALVLGVALSILMLAFIYYSVFDLFFVPKQYSLTHMLRGGAPSRKRLNLMLSGTDFPVDPDPL